MKTHSLPKTDSIQELATFWDTHDLTDFQEELEEVTEPVFVRATPIQVYLEPSEAEAVQRIAQTKRVSQEQLVHEWVLERVPRRKGGRRTKHGG